MRLALAQMNTVVGDLDGNAERIAERLVEARAAGADLVLFPELAVTGYPPEDLLLRPAFVRAARRSVDDIAARTRGITALVGAPYLDADLYNACYVLADGEIRAVYRKRFLPNYGVFDEDRYFAPARDLVLLRFGDVYVGPTICEDIWQPGPPATDMALAGAQLVANISASPFHVGKDREREEMLRVRARDNSLLRRVLQRGRRPGRADLRRPLDRARRRGRADRPRARLRGGAARRRRRSGRRRRPPPPRRAPPRARAGALEPPEAQVVELPAPRAQVELLHPEPAPQLDDLEQMRQALELGLRDYVDKNGFGDVVIGLSGGIDSALTAALAVEAIGADRVHGVSMPSRYSSDAHAATRSCSPSRSASTSASWRSSPSSRRSPTCSRRRSPAASPTSPRRTSRRGSAARC